MKFSAVLQQEFQEFLYKKRRRLGGFAKYIGVTKWTRKSKITKSYKK